MSIDHDPFEKAFFDYLAGKRDVYLVVHCNKGEDERIPVRYFFRKYDEMPEIEKIALSFCKGRVLDVGAGAGCHTIYLQQQGYDVVAIDIRPGLASVMNHLGVKNVIAGDVFDLVNRKFDTLLLLMNGIGFGGSLVQLEKFLVHARQLLEKDGQILLDSSDLYYLSEEEDGSCRIDLGEDYYGEVVFTVEYNGLTGNSFPWLFVDFGTLEQLALKTGFTAELIHEGDHFEYLAKLYRQD